MAQRQSGRIILGIAAVLAAAAGAGCETMEKKFVRKSKKPRERPSPVIQFQDYSRGMTPLDRYRKHYMIFDYWNSDLIDALQVSSTNPKRYKRASQDALEELVTMQALLTDEKSAALAPLIDERTKLDRQLQAEAVSGARMSMAVRILESQGREINRNFFWRDVEDALKPQEPLPAADAPVAAGEALAPAEIGTPGDAGTP